MNFSRRNLLKGFAGGFGAAAGTKLAGPSFLRNAIAAGQKNALVCVCLPGGYNSMFSSANSYVGKEWQAMKAADVMQINSELFVHKLIGNLPGAKTNMASVGINNITANHSDGMKQMFGDGKTNYLIKLASEMSGGGSIKAACIGPYMSEQPARTPINGVSLELVNDMSSTLAALGSGGPAPDPNAPARDLSAAVLGRSHEMSAMDIKRNPLSMQDFDVGYSTVIDTLKKPIPPIPSFASVAAEYEAAYVGKNRKVSTVCQDLYSKFVGAEMMLRAGTNVVLINECLPNDTGTMPYDFHYIVDGSGEIDYMTCNDYNSQQRGTSFFKGFEIFLNHIFNSPDLAQMNITVALFGEISRSVPDSGHQGNQTATVFGRGVKSGQTGLCTVDAELANRSTPGPRGFWGYLAKLAGVTTKPFGADGDFHDRLIA